MFKAQPDAKPGDADAQQKSTFDILLTSTPVIMTIVATLLAGLSTSEMTQAQYNRSLAAQHQSKSGDQWSLFQAKRVRGTILEMTAVGLHGMPGSLDGDALQRSADRLVAELRQGVEEGKKLTAQVTASRSELGPASAPLTKAAERFLKATEEKLSKAEGVQKNIGAALADANVLSALTYLATDKVPEPVGIDQEPFDDRVKQALAEIAQRKTEEQTKALIAPIPTGTLVQAITQAEHKAQALDDATQPVSHAIKKLDQVVNDETALVRSFDRSARELTSALEQANLADGKGTSEVRRSVDAIRQIATIVKGDVDEVGNDYRSAVIGFNARRYAREARYNQQVAELYEIQVRKSSVESDRHVHRSRLFFFGMLAAQAGVTIASLALAVRLKSVLWGLACTAGVIALLIGGYVYLSV